MWNPNQTGSGPYGSLCQTACDYTKSVPDQGTACNLLDGDGGTEDCPLSATQSFKCGALSPAPTSLGVCVAQATAHPGQQETPGPCGQAGFSIETAPDRLSSRGYFGVSFLTSFTVIQ